MKNLKNRISIPAASRKSVSKIVNTLHDNGFECYLVGGSIRDLILRREVYDFDFATNAHPEKVMGLFKKVVPTGIKHGTVMVIINRKSYEITTYRADGKYIDGRRPERVTFSKTLQEDVVRRDFTINGLAYDFINDELIDYVSGIEDIEKGIIRTIGDPIKRFGEDGLRPLRACRFASKLGFEIEEETFGAIGKSLDIVKLVSAERVRDEIMKIMESDKPSVGIEYMRMSGLLELFIPELLAGYNVHQNKYHLYDIYYHSLYSCDSAPKEEPLIRLASLLHDLGKVITKKEGEEDGEATFYNHEIVGGKIAKKILRRLKFSNEDSARIINLVINHMFHYKDEWTDGAVRRFIRKVGLENIEDLILLRLSDRKGSGIRDGMPAPIKVLRKRIQKVIDDDNALKVTDLDIDGHVLMDLLNIKPGPIIGRLLNELLELVLDEPELNNREALEVNAREIYNRVSKE